MVFVETPKALTAKLYPEVLPPYRVRRRGEHRASGLPGRRTSRLGHAAKIGDFPLVVISNDYGASVEPNTDEATNVDDQRGWFDLSPNDARQ